MHPSKIRCPSPSRTTPSGLRCIFSMFSRPSSHLPSRSRREGMGHVLVVRNQKKRRGTSGRLGSREEWGRSGWWGVVRHPAPLSQHLLGTLVLQLPQTNTTPLPPSPPTQQKRPGPQLEDQFCHVLASGLKQNSMSQTVFSPIFIAGLL